MGIKIKNLSFSYGNHKVLQDVNLNIENGQTVTLLGPNGAGKSTLFKCILGLTNNFEGEILIDGSSIKDMTSRQRAKAISYIPQKHSQAYDFTALEIVLMGCSVKLTALQTPGKNEIANALRAMQLIGIEYLKDRKISQISGGEQQMTLIARAIAQNGKILVLDEPTSALDFGNVIKVQKCIKGLSEKGYTIIQSSHQPEQAYWYSDKIAALKDGTIFKFGHPKDIIKENILSELYNNDIKIISVDDDSARMCLPKF